MQTGSETAEFGHQESRRDSVSWLRQRLRFRINTFETSKRKVLNGTGLAVKPLREVSPAMARRRSEDQLEFLKPGQIGIHCRSVSDATAA